MKSETEIREKRAKLRGERTALKQILESGTYINQSKALKYADELAEIEKQIDILDWILI